ncbi:MAG: hypothetical protein ACJAYB_001256 [Psychromonas sp.]|jgi:hypothetical protein
MSFWGKAGWLKDRKAGRLEDWKGIFYSKKAG